MILRPTKRSGDAILKLIKACCVHCECIGAEQKQMRGANAYIHNKGYDGVKYKERTHHELGVTYRPSSEAKRVVRSKSFDSELVYRQMIEMSTFYSACL